MHDRVIARWNKKAKFQYDEKLLREIFGKYGEISEIQMRPKKSSCFIEFTTREAAISSCEEDGNSHTGLEVKYVKPFAAGQDKP